MIPRLGVNIDHVRTLERQRLVEYPSLERSAHEVLKAGADQITIHLREDQRHIQNHDPGLIKSITSEYNKPLNFEMGTSSSVIQEVKKVKPEWVCLVPEKREERTTEGGLGLTNKTVYQKTQDAMNEIRDVCPDTQFSLFLEAEIETLQLAKELQAEAVEIHTGEFANLFLELERNPNTSAKTRESFDKTIINFQEAYEYLKSNNIACHAGHGLTDKSVIPLLDLGIFAEYNIGHWIVAEAIFQGIGTVTKNLKELFQTKPAK